MIATSVIFDRLLEKLEGHFSAEDYDAILGVHPKAPAIETFRSAAGTYTIFDTIFDNFQRGQNAASASFDWRSADEAESTFQSNLFFKRTYPVEIDISVCTAVSSSRSNLYKYEDLEAFGEKNYKHYREDKYNGHLTEGEYFEKCFNQALWKERETFEYRPWVPNLKWISNGGSHRFSTAHYMARTQGIPGKIYGDISVYFLNRHWLSELYSRYDAYILEVPIYAITEIRKAFRNKEFNNTCFSLREKYSGLQRTTTDNSPTTEIVILLISKSSPIPRVAKRWLQTYLINRSCFLETVFTSMERIEESSIQKLNQELNTGEIELPYSPSE